MSTAKQAIAEQVLREEAEDRTYKVLLDIAARLVKPAAERFGIVLWRDGVTTPEGEELITALITLPNDPRLLPDRLVRWQMRLLVEKVLVEEEEPEPRVAPAGPPSPPEPVTPSEFSALRPLEPPVEEQTKKFVMPPAPPGIPHGMKPPSMARKGRVPPFTNENRRKFAKYLKTEGDCWIWNGIFGGAKNVRATPQFRIGSGKTRDTYHARRTAMWLFSGVYSDKRVLAPSCGNKKCVHPDHVTQKGSW